MNAPEKLKTPSRSASELTCIVRVNEEIKSIVATAFRINLMALNAIFLAKRAGNAALGFGVLSNELRRFAQDLTHHMASLRDMTSGSVGSVTGVVQQQRNSAILLQAIRLSGDGVPGVREARKRGAQRLAEQHGRLRALDLRLRAAVEETQQLVELGGDVVEGLLIVQNYDHEDNSPRFREFSEAYFKRFQRSPGYSSVSAYDAATVVLDALRKRQGGETLKDALLKNSPYQGLQQEIAFDANGDTTRVAYFMAIRDGRFVRAQ